MEANQLAEILRWLCTAAGCGTIAFAIIEYLPFLQRLAPEPKRLASYVIAGGIAVSAYVIQILFGYAPNPGTPLAWVEALFGLLMSAFGMAELIHGRLVLSKKTVPEVDAT